MAALLLVASVISLGRPADAATCASSVGPGVPPPPGVPSGIPGFHAAWFGQSGYMSLCPGDRMTATHPREPEFEYATVAVIRSPGQSDM